MGEALIVRRGVTGGAKVAEGFPKQMSGSDAYTIPDLIGCNGFALFSIGSASGTGSIGGNSPGSIISVFYDGDTVVYCRVTSSSTSTSIRTYQGTGDFDPLTGEITLSNSFSSTCTTQCIYW